MKNRKHIFWVVVTCFLGVTNAAANNDFFESAGKYDLVVPLKKPTAPQSVYRYQPQHTAQPNNGKSVGNFPIFQHRNAILKSIGSSLDASGSGDYHPQISAPEMSDITPAQVSLPKFSSTSLMLPHCATSIETAVSQIENVSNASTERQKALGFPSDPSDPFLEPIGDAPWALLFLLLVAYLKIRK